MKSKLDAITLATGNVPAMRDFYSQRFGWQLLGEADGVAFLRMGDTVLTLLNKDAHAKYIGAPAVSTGNKDFYFTINTNSPEDTDRIIAQLAQDGVRIVKQPEKVFWGGYMGMVADPEGNYWEICYNPMGNPAEAAPTVFAPMLIHRDGNAAIEFYKTAFDAELVRRWNNDDGSVHVAELSIGGAMFHIRQEGNYNFDPREHGGVTAISNLFTDDPDALFNRAIAAGAEQLSPMQNFDYGYRQGGLKDPFGHQWIISKEIV